MPSPPSESDYGSELDWTDATLDAALTAIERAAASLNSSANSAAVIAASTSREASGAGDADASDTAIAQGGVVTGAESADVAATAPKGASPPVSLW